ncbi:MAG: L,D-transpeptidase [Acidobacteria bacterium]|nr:L,D-transpeptidase [Acidobacteriota bacterium]
MPAGTRLAYLIRMRERRRFPRPPLWLNLGLLILAGALFAYASNQRKSLVEKTAILFKPTASSPAEVNRIRGELADMEVSQAQLSRELDGRMDYLQAVQSAQFYLSIDTQHSKLQLRLGKDVVREADVQIGESKTISAKDGRKWTFVPLKGGFNIQSKEVGYAWRVPEWLYAMNNEPIPSDRPTIENGLGKYVIFLPDNYVIHSPPSAESPLKGPKPGSFLVSEQDLAAIWPRITKDTRVYIF